MNTVDTIAALATGPGGAISIVRISGERAVAIGNSVWRGKAKLDRAHERRMLYGTIGDPGEPALAVCMLHPHSYTGEDVVELHVHGGAVAGRRTLAVVLAQPGVRSAEPGEFTMRAFVNGKLDLTQAEAVGDLISAGSDSAFQLAARQLAGRLSEVLKRDRETLLALAADCESRLDFPDEELEWDPASALTAKVNAVQHDLARLLDTANSGAILRDGVRIVLAGRPNAGKSSLLNALLKNDRAIVSAVPGTTRDTLEESAVLRGIVAHLTDTAGLRTSADEIEAAGIARAEAALTGAQIVFWLLDAASPDPAAELAELEKRFPQGGRVIAVWNKLDLAGNKVLPEPAGVATVRISALTGDGVETLLDAMQRMVWQSGTEEVPEVAVNARHAELLAEARAALDKVPEELAKARWELAAAGIRSALAALGRVLGESADPDLLENIFSRFCIGK